MTRPALTYAVKLTRSGRDGREQVETFHLVMVEPFDPERGHPVDQYGEDFRASLRDAGFGMAAGASDVPVFAPGRLDPVAYVRRRP